MGASAGTSSMAAPAVMPRQNAPSSGGKGGANRTHHMGMQ